MDVIIKGLDIIKKDENKKVEEGGLRLCLMDCYGCIKICLDKCCSSSS